MNESVRTLTFLGAAALVSLVAWVSRPAVQAPAVSGGQIVKAFDVGDASSLLIERYDADEGKLVSFQVAKEGGRWIIPSHDGYPADAEAQLQKVAGLFTGLKAVGSPASVNPQQHGLYGLREPAKDTSGDGKEFGRVVSITDAQGEKLVNLVVGKPAQATSGSDSEKGASGPLRFVRVVGQDAVYVAEISLDAITTKFEDWIERDLLKLNAFDVAKLDLHDYSLVPVQDADGGMALSMMRRMDTQVKWNSESNGWELAKMTLFQANQPLEGELAPDEELNKTKLDGVKTAVDDLKIADVERKPPVLFQALKDEKLARDQRARQELQEYGFFVQREQGSSKAKVVATNGGLSVSMKDGVQYVLNFGNPKSADKEDSSKLNRYLMVTAQVDESMLPKPMLEAEDEPLGPEQPTDEKPADEPAKDKSPTEEEQDRENTGDKQDEKALGDEDGEPKETAKPANEEKQPADEQKPDEDAAKKRREAIKKSNKQKLDKYHDDHKKAEARVAELNARFNDWFYVVSDDVYKKVQLGRADLVKDSGSAKDAGFGVDAFRKLQEGGIEGKAAAAPPSAPPGPPGGFPGFPGQ